MVSNLTSYHRDRCEHTPSQNPNSNDSHHAHLRLALGSILSPVSAHFLFVILTNACRLSALVTHSPWIVPQKRPHSAQSSISGTASPAPFSHHPGRPSHLPPDHSVHPLPAGSSRVQALSTPDSSSQSSSSSPHGSPRQHPLSEEHADSMVQQVQSPVPVTSDADAPTRPPLAVVYTNNAEHRVETQMPSSGQRTPSGRFIATLQSKSAWDALIHGSMV
jgi:hypothetical protein